MVDMMFNIVVCFVMVTNLIDVLRNICFSIKIYHPRTASDYDEKYRSFHWFLVILIGASAGSGVDRDLDNMKHIMIDTIGTLFLLVLIIYMEWPRINLSTFEQYFEYTLHNYFVRYKKFFPHVIKHIIIWCLRCDWFECCWSIYDST